VPPKVKDSWALLLPRRRADAPAARPRRARQVLTKALELWSLEALPYASRDVRSAPGFDPVKEAAFICNLSEHWVGGARWLPGC
jgi:hypothetical protein